MMNQKYGRENEEYRGRIWETLLINEVTSLYEFLDYTLNQQGGWKI
jgi:hypothetical protein